MNTSGLSTQDIANTDTAQDTGLKAQGKNEYL
jgi:hypothetical protein